MEGYDMEAGRYDPVKRDATNLHVIRFIFKRKTRQSIFLYSYIETLYMEQ